jgi:hypothetical protein
MRALPYRQARVSPHGGWRLAGQGARNSIRRAHSRLCARQALVSCETKQARNAHAGHGLDAGGTRHLVGVHRGERHWRVLVRHPTYVTPASWLDCLSSRAQSRSLSCLGGEADLSSIAARICIPRVTGDSFQTVCCMCGSHDSSHYVQTKSREAACLSSPTSSSSLRRLSARPTLQARSHPYALPPGPLPPPSTCRLAAGEGRLQLSRISLPRPATLCFLSLVVGQR